jgi:hypothetical protein
MPGAPFALVDLKVVDEKGREVPRDDKTSVGKINKVALRAKLAT